MRNIHNGFRQLTLVFLYVFRFRELDGDSECAKLPCLVMHRVLVTGATSIVGRELVSQLRDTGAHVRALTRSPESASLPAEVDVYRGDLTVPDTLEPALAGTESVFLIWTVSDQTVEPVIRRIAAHARRIVYLSAPYKTPHPFFQQPNPLRILCQRVEESIVNSGVEWTFLRPGIFAANSLRWWVPQIQRGNIVRWPYAAVETAPTHERDIAAVAARTLCDDGHAGGEYVLTGPQSLTQSEQVSIIGRAIGRNLVITEISPDEARRELVPLFAPFIIEMLMSAWAAAAGQPALVSSTVQDILGRPALTFREWAVEHAPEFSQVS